MQPIRNKNIQRNRMEQEGLKEQVIHVLKSSKISNICKAAIIYGISYTGFQNQNNGTLSCAKMNSKKKKWVNIEKRRLYIEFYL